MNVAAVFVFAGVAAAAGPVTTLEEVFTANERFRATVTRDADGGGVGWLDPAFLDKSIFNYGLTRDPRSMLPKVAMAVGERPIEHDLLTYLAARVKARAGRLHYLEIGVSVLKSFDTQAHFHANASFTAMDIEDPNWQRAGRWGAVATELARPSTGMRHRRGRTVDHIYEWSRVPTERPLHAANRVRYVEGDALVPDGWLALAARKRALGEPPFNFVLSDGLHTAGALRAEMAALLEHRLLAGSDAAGAGAGAGASTSSRGGGKTARVLIAWDDCGGLENEKLRKAVEGPLYAQFKAARLGPTVCYTRVSIPGWIGQGEHEHGCCLLSTFNMREWFKPEHAAAAASSGPAAAFARQLFKSATTRMRCEKVE